MTTVLRIDGPPIGKARPRFVKATGRTYTPSATVRAEDRVRLAWENAGQPWHDGPLRLELDIVIARPGSHYRVNGELSKTAARTLCPVKRPDLDNVLKLVADALNGCAYRDDAQIVQALVVRRWVEPGEREHLLVRLWPVAGGVFELGTAA